MKSYPKEYRALKKNYDMSSEELMEYMRNQIMAYAKKVGGQTILSKHLKKSEKYVTMGLRRGNFDSILSIWLRCFNKYGAL